MFRISSFLALLLLSTAMCVLSAPVANSETFQNELLTIRSAGTSFFSSTNSEQGALVAPSGHETRDVVPGEERAVSVSAPMKRKVLASGNHRRITIINSTPYRWVRKYVNQYQIDDWADSWPKYIESGQAVVSETKFYGGKRREDTGAEVTYMIEGTCDKMGFQVKYNPERTKEPDVRIKYLGALKTRWTSQGSEVRLGQNVMKGGVNWLLAGPENDFWSTHGPVGWMQEQIKDIGKFPLNEIIMPRSHHAGMNKGRTGVGIVYDETTLTQTRTPYEQMQIGGVRVLDFRPYLRRGKTFSAGHFSKIAGLHHGMIGISLGEIIDDINRFQNEYPGELIILDIHDNENWNGGDKFRKLKEKDHVLLYKELSRLDNLFSVPTDVVNVHRMPLNSFIGDGKSAVLIHAPDPWKHDKAYPGQQGGYVTNRNFPRTAYWSDTDMSDTLQAEQIATLKLKKTYGRGGQVHDSQWILRLGWVQYVFPVLPLTELAKSAWGRLYGGLWNGSNDQRYPNWVTLDAYEGEDAKMLVMTMNRCLVAGKCGKLGGKAPGAKELELPTCPKKGPKG